MLLMQRRVDRDVRGRDSTERRFWWGLSSTSEPHAIDPDRTGSRIGVESEPDDVRGGRHVEGGLDVHRSQRCLGDRLGERLERLAIDRTGDRRASVRSVGIGRRDHQVCAHGPNGDWGLDRDLDRLSARLPVRRIGPRPCRGCRSRHRPAVRRGPTKDLFGDPGPDPHPGAGRIDGQGPVLGQRNGRVPVLVQRLKPDVDLTQDGWFEAIQSIREGSVRRGWICLWRRDARGSAQERPSAGHQRRTGCGTGAPTGRSKGELPGR